MAEEISRVEVEIFGERYVFKGDAPSEHIRRLAEDVDRRVWDIVNRHSRIPTSKAAILVAVNLADELDRLQDSYDSLVRMIEAEKVK